MRFQLLGVALGCLTMLPVVDGAPAGDPRQQSMSGEELVHLAPSDLAQSVAALESALTARDDDALLAALRPAVRADNRELLALFERVLEYPVTEAARVEAETKADRLRKVYVDIGRNDSSAGSEAAQQLRDFDAWRPHGIAVLSWSNGQRLAELVCDAVEARDDAGSFNMLVRALGSRTVRANPLRLSVVIKALTSMERSSRALDDELCELFASVEEFDTELWSLTQMPMGELTYIIPCVALQPYIDAARYFSARGTERRAVATELIDGLILGRDHFFEDPRKTRVGWFQHPELAAAHHVGEACELALRRITKQTFAWGDPASHAAASTWLKEHGKKAGLK